MATDPCLGGTQPSSSSPFWIGTLLFFAVAVIFNSLAWVLGKTGRFDMQSVKLAYVLTPLAVVCMWLMWASVWLSQWHPIICPQFIHEEE